MPATFLHHHKEFPSLLRITGEERGILPSLVEKDYWIMHVLYGLTTQGFQFELKGGTSLSKGYGIIQRFSEDIDIHIRPPQELGVEENPSRTKEKHIQSRKDFYDWLASQIKIDGIVSVERDTAFDDKDYYRSGGIRLFYESKTERAEGIKEGILLEAGFDTVTPNQMLTISSWAFDRASVGSIDYIDNRAVNIICYHPGYTFVEKLQTIATKFRQERTDGNEHPNYMRQYYDIYCLLGMKEVQDFIGTEEYQAHKKARFPKKDYDIPIAENEAFSLQNPELRRRLIIRYQNTVSLYYQGQPPFEELLSRIRENVHKL